MQTALSPELRQSLAGSTADAILRSCVHCGFCNATCPTYQLLGDELDGPRGRIYLIKQMLEGNVVTGHTLTHLDRCLTCRNCETTCPSGVRYGALLEIGRAQAEEKISRPWQQRAERWLLRKLLPYPQRFLPLLRVAQGLRPFLPADLKRRIPPYQSVRQWPHPGKTRRMLLLDGCVQPAIAPGINQAAAQVFDRLGISLVRAPAAGCCGAVCHHTSGVDEGLALARRNIDAWWPLVEAGAEAIVMTASGCGVHVKDYGELLAHDRVYADKARRIASLTRDISEVLAEQDLSQLQFKPPAGCKVAFQSPCTLQHGQRLNGVVEKILRDVGAELTTFSEAHLCCGSAGTYSLLQPNLAQRLRQRKLTALEQAGPKLILTANIGCLTHLQSAAGLPVQHWIEWLATYS